MKISVVVPVYNERDTVCQTVERLLAQTLRPHEIIVVDDGSTDETASVLRARFSDKITVLSQANRGPAAARNCGIRVAEGDYVAFTDGDCLPEREWLAEIVKGFAADNVAGAGGTVRRADDGLISEYVDARGILNPCTREGQVECLVTANACFRRDVLIQADMFDERFERPGGEDSELSVRIRSMGYIFRHVHSAVVLHHHRRTVPAFLKMMRNYGAGNYIFSALWPEWGLQFNPRAQMLRSAFAFRNMVRLGAIYRKEFGLKRAIFFSLLEHYGLSAYIWGNLSESRRQRRLLRTAAREVACREVLAEARAEALATPTDKPQTVLSSPVGIKE